MHPCAPTSPRSAGIVAGMAVPSKLLHRVFVPCAIMCTQIAVFTAQKCVVQHWGAHDSCQRFMLGQRCSVRVGATRACALGYSTEAARRCDCIGLNSCRGMQLYQREAMICSKIATQMC
eukprot:6375384-Amphidinium_carterae.1